MKELPRKFKDFVVAHGPQSLIVLVGGAALVVSGMFLMGSPAFGLQDDGAATGAGSQAEVVPGGSTVSIKDQDGDEDGLSDLEERLYHTNPESADTDADGYKDGEEVENGYDPASKLSAGADGAGSGVQSSGSILSLLNSSSTGDSSVSGVGGLGGLTDEQTEQLGQVALPDGQKIADLEVDQILNKGSQPLPTVDPKDIKTSSDTSADAELKHFNAVSKLAIENNPFPAQYSVKKYLTDVEAGNRDLFEKMKFASETILQRMQDMTVPESLVEEHAHGLAIVMASRDVLQQVLDSNVSSDSILHLLGRSFFVMGEFRAMLQDTLTELQS